MNKMAAEMIVVRLIQRLIFFSAAIFIVVMLFGCTTTQKPVTPKEEQTPVEKKEEPVYVPLELTEVNPLALIGSDFSIYTFIPANKHKSLTIELLMEEIENLAEVDAKLIAKRIDKLYFGLGTVEDRSRLEAAASGNIPTIGVKTTFTKKSGWLQTPYTATSSEQALKLRYPNEFTYYSHDECIYDLCFFTQQIFAIAQDLTPVMEKYALRPEPEDTMYNRWISQESDDILFYITRPGQYLRSLIGASITSDTDYSYGSITQVKDDIYSMTMDLHVTNESSIGMLKSMLELSFGLMDVSLTQPSKDILRVSGVEVSQSQIVNLFTRDPITGKHYRVQDDTVIEEAM